jgi:hypothetical protein
MAFGATSSAADGNIDGIVGAADYVVWRKFSVVAAESAKDLPIGVPEPRMLVIVGGLFAAAGRGRLMRSAFDLRVTVLDDAL